MPSKAKQVKQKKKPRRKTTKPLQRQSQKQVVNITFEKPKKSKRKKKRKQAQEIMPQQILASRMDLLSSDTARVDSLFNRLYDLQNRNTQPQISTPIPIAQPITINPDVMIPEKPIKASTPPPAKSLPVAQAVEIVNPPLVSGGVIGGASDIYDIFKGIFNQDTGEAKVKKQKPPPQAPTAPTRTYTDFSVIGNPLNPSLLEPPINEPPILPLRELSGKTFDVDVDDIKAIQEEEEEIPLVVNRPKRFPEPFGYITPPDGFQADLLNPNTSFKEPVRGSNLKKVKKKLKLKVKEREKEKADEYKGVKITPDFDVDAFPVVPLVAQNADPVLIPFRDEGKNLYSIGDEIIPPEDIEESRELTRKYRERSDKGIRRGFYKPTLDKNKADDFRREQIFRNQDSVVRSDETLLRDIFGDWRQTTTDSIAL